MPLLHVESHPHPPCLQHAELARLIKMLSWRRPPCNVRRGWTRRRLDTPHVLRGFPGRCSGIPMHPNDSASVTDVTALAAVLRVAIQAEETACMWRLHAHACALPSLVACTKPHANY